MKERLLELIHQYPKHYTRILRKTPELVSWIYENSVVKSDSLAEMAYSAIYQESNICKNGNRKKFDRFSTGFVGCGPASLCECTRTAIANSVSATKSLLSEDDTQKINQKREKTMQEKYGAKFNSQRPELKHIWKKSKLSLCAESKLSDREWLYHEYIEKQRSLVDIAQELNVYYSTVGEYCKKFDFSIRQRSNYSLTEKDIIDFLTSLGVSAVHSDWSVLGNRELDILLPDHNIAIEVNGLYWHSFNPSMNQSEDRLRHLQKTNDCAEKEISLIHITDYEWHHKTNIVKAILKSRLGLNQKLFARNCEIKPVSKFDEKEFLNNFHIQGHIPSKYAIGLYYANELVMLMTAGRSRYDRSTDTEILRMCSKPNITVVGGVSKLAKAIKSQTNSDIITYCDLSKSNGSGYRAAGFTWISNSDPGYFWTDGNTIVSRYRTQKTQMAKWLDSYNPDLSQAENMFLAGYRRYWDCGNAVFKF